MAAVLRVARAGRGGPGRAQGRQRGGVVHDVPAQERDTPLNYQWAYWRPGNENLMKKKNKKEEQQLKMYRVLENSPRVNKMELVYFIIPEGLLNQRDEIVNKLRDVVSLYNMMMPLRREYLYKNLDGYWGDETEKIAKVLTRTLQCVDEKIDEILTAGGNCPPHPKVFDQLPKLTE